MTAFLILLALVFMPWQVGIAVLIGMLIGPVAGVISLILAFMLTHEGE